MSIERQPLSRIRELRAYLWALLAVVAITSFSFGQSIPGTLSYTDTYTILGGPLSPCHVDITYYTWTFTDPSGGTHQFPGTSSTTQDVGSCKGSSSTSLDEWSTDGLFFLAATGSSASITASAGYLNPKYKIMGVTYAPPGGNANSSVSYADTNYVGNSSTNGSSFNQTYTFSISVCSTVFEDSCNPADTGGGTGLFGFSGGAQITGTETDSWSLASNASTTITTSKQTSLTQVTPGVPNVYSPFDHDYDLVWVWLNPVALFTIVPDCSGSKTCLYWNGYGYDWNDPAHTADVRPILVGYLNGDFKKADGSSCYATDATCDPGDASALSRNWVTTQTFASGQSPAITAADLPSICGADPFCSNPGYLVTLEPGVTPPTTTDQRYTLSAGDTQDFSYSQAGLGSTKGETEVYNQQYSSTTSKSQGGSYTYSQGIGMEEKFGGTFFGIGVQTDIKQTLTFTWEDTWQNTVTNTITQTDIATITGPPCPSPTAPCVPVYSEPGEFTVYQDNLYGTFMFWPNPYFTIFETPATQTVKAGAVTTYSIPTAAVAGYSGKLTSFSITGLPSGATASFSPSSGTPGFTSTLTISTATSTPAGTYALTISATDGSLTYYACIPGGCPASGEPYATLVVTAQPSFSLAVTPTSETVGVGSSPTYTATTTAMNGFASVVDLNVTVLPSNCSASFNPETITGSGSSALTITTTGNTPPGAYPLTFTGTSGSLTETAMATLVVTGANFTLSAIPEIQSINAGNSTTYTVSTTAVSGFDGVVSLSLSALPSGASATFNPTSITGAGSSTLTITTKSSTPAGDYNLTITGTSGSLQPETASIEVEVNN
jgi:hypothetical protein